MQPTDIFRDDFDIEKKISCKDLKNICKEYDLIYNNKKQATAIIKEYISFKQSQTKTITIHLFVKVMKQLIPLMNCFHNSGISLPLTSEYFENILHNAFIKTGIATDWKPNRSHQVGKDMELYNYENSKISCKSGIIQNNILTISGSRTSTHPTLEEKIHHLCIKRENWYLCLAKDKPFTNKYLLCIFKSELITESIENVEAWKSTKYEDGTFKNASCLCVKNIKSIIQNKNTSNQFWCSIPLDAIDLKVPINININNSLTASSRPPE
jgi:hypothetical protein